MKYSGALNRLRNDCRKGVVVAVIGGVFVVGSEVLETLVPVHDEKWGIVIALVIIALLRPLQWLALYIAGQRVKQTHPTRSAEEQRKLDVYRAAFAGALEDGVVTEKEKCILKRLRENLQLSEADIERLEREL